MNSIKTVIQQAIITTIENIIFLCFVVCWFFVLKTKKWETKPRLVWGHTAIISYKYWSKALSNNSFIAHAIVNSYTTFINSKDDYQFYTNELYPYLRLDAKRVLGFVIGTHINLLVSQLLSFTYILKNYDICHHAFWGGYLGETRFWRLESFFYKLASIKVVITPIGADAYLYSDLDDFCLRHVLLLSLPHYAKQEANIRQRVNYWQQNADAIVTGWMLDSMSRWDVLAYNPLTINTSQWSMKTSFSQDNGKHGLIKVIHTPNFRGFKGTEFVINAVNELQSEGLKIELILLEKRPNEEVRLLMQEADIQVEQLIMGYALSAVEGMASGLPVLSNLDNENYTRLFRRYSYLNECPILSTSPESIKENLRILILNPQLREELGKAGRQYVEKYHSEETAQYMFGAIYDKIWYQKEVDLMNLFDPLKSEYNRSKPIVKNPLIENSLPQHYLKIIKENKNNEI